jgi:hypothetical protein
MIPGLLPFLRFYLEISKETEGRASFAVGNKLRPHSSRSAYILVPLSLDHSCRLRASLALLWLLVYPAKP